MITTICVPMVENILTVIGDQKLGVNDLSFVNMLCILKMGACFTSRILLARASSPLSVRLNILTDCIRLKLLFFSMIS